VVVVVVREFPLELALAKTFAAQAVHLAVVRGLIPVTPKRLLMVWDSVTMAALLAVAQVLWGQPHQGQQRPLENSLTLQVHPLNTEREGLVPTETGGHTPTPSALDGAVAEMPESVAVTASSTSVSKSDL
jgi:hypothetical protein